MNQDERRKIAEDIDRLKFKLVEAAEQIIDVVNAGFKSRAQDRRAPAHVARRQVANMLRLSQFCANRACRRSHCCRGEPRHCLQAVIPLLPAMTFEGLLKKRRSPSPRSSPRKRGPGATDTGLPLPDSPKRSRFGFAAAGSRE